MRRRISLYIDGSLADLADDGLVLMNYAAQDLTNPAILRNSWSQDVDLPRTPANARIFGHSGRLDRLAGSGGTGPDFNASRKVPFVIYAETSEALVSGYLKLQTVTPDAYRVSLFGGLGELLWNLSYDTAGNKRSLADLDYGVELDFTITKETVREAWARLGGDASKPAKWDVINFAPALNGIPQDFSADKAVADPAGVSLDVPAGYATQGGYTLVSLAGDRDELDVRDMRSYLQRPVVSMDKILEACADPVNNGGWTVDLSAVTIPQRDTWLTRPLLPSLGTFKQASGAADMTFDGSGVGRRVARFALEDTPLGTELTVRMQLYPVFSVPGASAQTLYPKAHVGGAQYTAQLLFIQPVGYDSDGNPVAYGDVTTLCGDDYLDAASTAEYVGFTPEGGAGFLPTQADWTYVKETAGVYKRFAPLSLEIVGTNIARIDVMQRAYKVYYYNGVDTPYMATGFGDPYALLFTDAADADSGVACSGASSTDGTGSASMVGADTLRSGARITKEMLLSTSKTPAEYLVSFCKAFGCLILADAATKTAKVLPREAFFLNDVTDLSARVDRGAGLEVDPLAFDAKWYELRHESVGGRFEDEYLRTAGVQYGIQRIDTGYDFDADVKDILAGSAFRSCAAVLARSKFYYILRTSGAVWYPSVFSAPGNTYTLWDGNGDAKEFDIEIPATIPTPLNADYPGYDTAVRPEFRDADGKPLDGADVLLYLQGFETSAVNVTDDLPVMDILNGGPCWLLAVPTPQQVPVFSRYYTEVPVGGTRPAVVRSLDFGIPRELDVPGLDYTGGTVYLDRWRKYIADRLSVHGKVLRCRVDLSGLQVGPELLRRFFWYEGSLWALSRISNYSLTTFDPAECEFIEVRDIDNYTT